MLYLAANNSRVHGLAAQGYPMGWMLSPASGYKHPRFLSWALDNGLYHAPDAEPKGMKALPPFYAMLDKVADLGPLFVVAPDVPYDMAASRVLSTKHARIIRAEYDVPVAIALQDGATPDDLDGYDWAFVAGSTQWKWDTAHLWADRCRERGMRCHIARVNTWSRIYRCIDIGADSADGSGIWRGDQHQLATVLHALVQPTLHGEYLGGLRDGVQGVHVARCA